MFKISQQSLRLPVCIINIVRWPFGALKWPQRDEPFNHYHHSTELRRRDERREKGGEKVHRMQKTVELLSQRCWNTVTHHDSDTPRGYLQLQRANNIITVLVEVRTELLPIDRLHLFNGAVMRSWLSQRIISPTPLLCSPLFVLN